MGDIKKYLNRVICGDCLEVMKELPDNCVDLVLTDPPYGIGKIWQGGKGHGWGKADAQKEVRNKWDDEPIGLKHIIQLKRIGKNAIIWGGNYFMHMLPPSRCWLVWNKPERNFTLAEAELAWTSFDNVVRVFDFRRSDPGRQHPTQKPLELIKWCLENYSEPGDTILDPFLGSGTTAVACKELGRDFIGIEINPEYCKIAENRLKQQVLNF